MYLKVKLRKEGTINRTDYTDVREPPAGFEVEARPPTIAATARDGPRTATAPAPRRRAEPGRDRCVSGGRTGDVRSTDSTRTGTTETVAPIRARGAVGPATTPRPASNSAIPAGQEIDVRLERSCSSATAQVGAAFRSDHRCRPVSGQRRADSGRFRGARRRQLASTKTTRTERKGSLTVAFDQLTVSGRDYPMRGTVTQALESEGIKGEAAKIGAGAGVGAIIGGIIGGVKGALLGVLIGGGGTIAATEGKDVTLPAGTILRVRLDTAARDSIALAPTALSRQFSAPMLMTGSWRSSPASAFLERGPRRFDCLLDVASRCGRPTGTTPRTATAAGRCRARACP